MQLRAIICKTKGNLSIISLILGYIYPRISPNEFTYNLERALVARGHSPINLESALAESSKIITQIAMHIDICSYCCRINSIYFKKG